MQRRLTEALRFAGVAAGLAVVVGGCWYVKNIVWTGNPVYPFLYSKFGGKNWSEFNAKIYTEEQNTFGIGVGPKGRHDIAQFPAAVLGLVTQPGRFTNPDPTHGGGFPFQSVGVVALATLLLWLFSGRAGPFEGAVCGMVALSLVVWFFMSQQSRYVIDLIPALSVLAGGMVARTHGRFFAIVIAGQAAYALWIVNSFVTSSQIQVVMGKVSTDEYLSSRVNLYKNVALINERVGGGKVALYDEVFGYLLDANYFWANPGHCTLIPYEDIGTGVQLADTLKSMGFTHIYVSLANKSKEDAQRLVAAMGLTGNSEPYPLIEKERADLRVKWRYLLAEAVASGRLTLIPSKGGLLFSITGR